MGHGELVRVRQWEERQPFVGDAFGLVLNHHGGFKASEVSRVLRPNGVFYTEQVHGLSKADLLAAFDSVPPWPHGTPERYVPELTAAGLQLRHMEDWAGVLVFNDVGAVVYYLKAIPWLVPGFSVATHLPYLQRLQARFEQEGRLTFTARTYLLEGVKCRKAAHRSWRPTCTFGTYRVP